MQPSDNSTTDLTRENNPNWKGGRRLSSHGYVLLRRPDHHAADPRGYVYEHRVVAEEKLGRKLEGSEEVHHINGDKQDNRPENLEVLSRAEHRARHRESDDLRDPGEPNPTVECACGCGETMKKYDDWGRPREFLPGHNSRVQEAPTQSAVLEVLHEEGYATTQELIERVETTGEGVKAALRELKEKSEIENPRRGMWALPGEDVPGMSKQERVESDEEIQCACGCGETLERFDEYGREREYISGHNTVDRDSPVQDEVAEILRELGGEASRAAIEDSVDSTDSSKSVGSAIRSLREGGLVADAGYGQWRLANGGED